MLYVVQTALELGFMYALVAMALFLSYRILDIADMTTDSGFVLGAAVSVTCAAAGHPVLAVFAAMGGGSLRRLCDSVLQTRMGVPSILAGIITNTGLYTVNLMVMGWSSNVSLLKQDTMFTLFRDLGIGGGFYKLILAGGITMFAGAALVWFLGTRLGLSIRATGDNRDMVRASSVNPVFTITVGLCISNALTALSGAVVGQYQKSAVSTAEPGSWSWPGLPYHRRDCSGPPSMGRMWRAAVTGSILYRFLYAMILKTSIVPIECLKLVTAVVVALAIASPSLREWAGLQKKKAEAKKRRGQSC